MIDVHTQIHEENWIEVGYLLEPKTLNSPILDDELADQSTLKNLKQVRSQSLEELIRGRTYSFGGIINAKFPSYKVIPSPNNLSPNGGNYFNGGNIIEQHTLIKSFPNFKFAGFQMELPMVLTNGTRKYSTNVGKNLAACIFEYYFVNGFDSK